MAITVVDVLPNLASTATMTKWRPLVATFLCIHPIPGHAKDAKEGPKGARKRKNQLPERDEVKDDIMTKIFLPFVLSVTPILLSNTASLSLSLSLSHTRTHTYTHTFSLSHSYEVTYTHPHTNLPSYTNTHALTKPLSHKRTIYLFVTDRNTHTLGGASHTHSLSHARTLTLAKLRTQVFSSTTHHRFMLIPKKKEFFGGAGILKILKLKKMNFFLVHLFLETEKKKKQKRFEMKQKAEFFFNFISFKGKPRF